ncbi:TonB-dependent receptor [Endozoicomonas sp. 4G]|uniref:TonB-dependent receptor domain-containing protein n=1 Tax=Endozoicomonas sp. 4G TaxID=2872754 RepID=UPI0020785749|nr:TonB-dependent receptor [Endozoicomonas sp. 4G]
MSSTLRITVALATAGLAGTLQASEEVTQLDEVVVTATRTAQSVDETLAPVTVISREDIERSQATDVTELLKQVPGIQVNRSGGPGALPSVFVRGASSSQTLVLVDGQRLNSPTAATPEFQYLTPDQIEKIEIVRGPKSSLYGADAIGGVIQIFTRRGQGDPKLTVKAGAGSRNTSDIGVNYGGEVNGTRFNIGASLFETAGYDYTNDNYPANTGLNLDDDGFRDKSFTSQLSHTFETGAELGFSFIHNQGKTEFDGYTTKLFKKYPYNAYTEFESSTANIYAVVPVSESFMTRVDAGYTELESKQLGKNSAPEAPYTPNYYDTKRYSVVAQGDISWLDSQLLTLGVDYYKDEVDSSSLYFNPETNKQVDSRYNAAIFAQNQSDFGWSDLQVGLRRDKNESFGYSTTGNIAWGVDLPESFRIVASYGTAFRAPSFNDLYYPESGNPDIKPETSNNVELALKGRHAIGNWSVALFQNDIKDLIAWAPSAADPNIWVPSNVDEARIKGIEAVIQKRIDDWNIRASATVLDAKDTKRDKVLARRAEQFATLDVDRQFGLFSVGSSIRAQGHSYDDAENTTRLAGFVTVDVRGGYRVTKELLTELKVVNLFDKDYQTANGYRSEPKGAFLTLTWTPEL